MIYCFGCVILVEINLVEAPGIEPERSGVNPNHERPTLPPLPNPQGRNPWGFFICHCFHNEI